MFHNSKDAINWIESVKKFGDKLDLTRMELACTILGHPEKELNVIHVAGTNGKGSTVSFLKHILLEQGYNVGTFTSPYIVRFNERITYNFNDISDDEFLLYVNKVYSLSCEVLEQFNEVITFFELITLISFLYFKDKKPDYVIYEVGLGGRLDATNVVSPIITAITSISFDHMGVLGDTIQDIALNKLGIVKEHIPLVTAIDQDDLKELFES
jgi:dihydrofolate synthase/folylpolyglutamate synthase